MEPTTDLLVLGGGVIGLACARQILIREPDTRVTIVDAPTGALPASLAAAGMLAPWAEFPERSLLADWCEASFRMYGAFAEQLVVDTGMAVSLLRHGTLIPRVPGAETAWQARVEGYRGRGVAFELLTGGDLQRAEPGLDANLSEGVLLPEATINPLRLHAALLKDVTWRGATVEIDRVVAFDRRENRLECARFESGATIAMENVLIATGAWTTQVAALAGMEINVTPIKGQVICLAAPDGLLHRVVHTRAVYLAPRPGSGIVVGATMEDVGFDSGTDAQTIAAMHDRAAVLVPAVRDLAVKQAWSGLRPRPTDGLPVLGWAPNRENLLLATGHFRNGILLTPFTAQFIARALVEGRTATATYGSR